MVAVIFIVKPLVEESATSAWRAAGSSVSTSKIVRQVIVNCSENGDAASYVPGPPLEVEFDSELEVARRAVVVQRAEVGRVGASQLIQLVTL